MEFLLRKLNWSDHTAWCQECKRPSVHFSPAKTFLCFEMMPANQSTWNLNHYHLMQFMIKKIHHKNSKQKSPLHRVVIYDVMYIFNFDMLRKLTKMSKTCLSYMFSKLCKVLAEIEQWIYNKNFHKNLNCPSHCVVVWNKW